MGFPYENIKSPQDYGSGKGTTVLGRSLIPSEVDGNLLALADAINAMLGQLSPADFGSRIDPTKAWVPIGTPYKQGPFDPRPDTIYCGNWTNVSNREPGLGRRVEGGLAGSFFTGVPAILSVSVSGGVPTITKTDGGSGYLSGGSGDLSLIIRGNCTVQMVAHATVVNGVITGIVVDTQGTGYTNGAIAVYDGVAGHGDLVQDHGHSTNAPASSGSSVSISYQGGAAAAAVATTMIPHGNNGSIRNGPENTGPYSIERYWVRTS